MLSLEEAIQHCKEVAEKNEKEYQENSEQLGYEEKFYNCKECAEEYRQLAEWLEELKEFKENEHVAYDNGIIVAWELAREICRMDILKRKSVFGIPDIEGVIGTFSYSTANEMVLEFYDTIQVGDIIVPKKSYDKDANAATRYVVVNITDKSYDCVSGKDFEPVAIGKDYIKDYYNLHDRKDLGKVARSFDGRHIEYIMMFKGLKDEDEK